MAKRNKKKDIKMPFYYNPYRPDLVEMPASFAKELIRQLTYNPKNSSSRKTYTYSIYTKENILKWLQSPAESTNEKNLRNASNYMYVSSMHYKRLLHYYAGLLVGAYVISPIGFDPTTDTQANLKKQYLKVSKFLEQLRVPHLLHSKMLQTIRDGVFYGVILSDNNSTIIQGIDPDYCTVTSICDGTFLYNVDMTKIASKLEFYPPQFTEMYTNYLETGEKWQEVPPEISFCIKADETIIDYNIPLFAAVMPSLYTIANTESLQETATELKNYKMLAGKIPMDDKGNPLMDDAMVMKYYSHIANALGDNVGLALTPFSFDVYGFENKSGTQDIDDLASAVSNFWSTAGTSGLLHGKENDTSGVTKLAIKNDETFVIGIAQQIERIINRYLKTNFSGSAKFKMTILPLTVFNREELLKYYKEAASFGLGKSYYAAALGIPQYDIAGLLYLEDNFVPFDKLQPLRSSYTDSGGGGRPLSGDDNLTESGEATRRNDSNANR